MGFHGFLGGGDSIMVKNENRIIVYQILVKHRGELSEKYLRELKETLFEYLGDVAKPDITIRRKNLNRVEKQIRMDLGVEI